MQVFDVRLKPQEWAPQLVAAGSYAGAEAAIRKRYPRADIHSVTCLGRLVAMEEPSDAD